MVQVSLGVEPISFGGLQNGEDNHAGVGPGLGVAEQPILASDHNGTDGVLNLVIADLDLAVVKEGERTGDGSPFTLSTIDGPVYYANTDPR